MGNTIVSYVPDEHNKVSAIVDHVLFKLTLSQQWFQWLLEMGLWELRQLKLTTWQDAKTELLNVTNRNTIDLPTDFVDWVMVAVPVGQYAVPLGINGDLKRTDRSIDDKTVAGLLTQNRPTGINLDNYVGYHMTNFHGRTVPVLDARMNIQKGSFKINETKNRKEILLDYDLSVSQLYVEYITDGFDPCGETVLHPYLCDFFKKAMEAAYEEYKNPNRTEASIYRKQRDLSDAKREIRAMRNNLDPQTMLNMQRQETRMTSHY